MVPGARVIGVANWGVEPLPIGGVVMAPLLLLAAVLQELDDRKDES